MTDPHHKHSKLARPAGGEWGRVEIALLGAPCAVIGQAVEAVIRRLPQYRIGYADASHAGQNGAEGSGAVRFIQTGDGASVSLDRYNGPGGRRALFNDCDIVLVNGNHFPAQQQIVFLHPAKSLAGKRDALTSVQLLIADPGVPVPDALLPVIEGVPRIALEDLQGLADFVERLIRRQTPPLCGLVLAGGQSLRMGGDKSLLQYHGRPQRAHVFGLLESRCREVFVSCNATQAAGLDLPKLEDRFLGVGPMGGILTAFQHAPDAAWLTVATDLPHLTGPTLDYLIAHRNPSRMATAFAGEDGLPEPLITIWEPRAYPLLLQALGSGISCPRKLLLSGDIELITPPVAGELHNVNLPADRDAALASLGGGAPQTV